MKKIIAFITTIALTTNFAFAEKSKVIDKHIPAAGNKKISFENFSSATIAFKSWDKPEVYIKLSVKVASTETEKEQALLDAINIMDNSNSDEVTIKMSSSGTTIVQGSGGSFFGSGTTYQQRDISGEIFVPDKSPVSAETKYGNYSFEGLGGDLSLEGSSNTLLFKNCAKLHDIESNYGKTSIIDCSGNLSLEAKSGKTKIENFKGAVTAEVDYSTFELKNLDGDDAKSLQLEAKSASLRLENIRQKMDIDAPYSKISLKNSSGDLRAEGNSASLSVENFSGNIIADMSYSAIKLKEISTPNLTLNARYSPVHVQMKTVPKSIAIENQYGSVSVEIPAGFSGAVNLETSYGKIDSNLPVVNKASDFSRQTESIKGNVGSGSGQITIKNKFAGIKLQQM